jgi:SAM-dependent methyltransferase
MFVGPEESALRVRGHMLRIDRPFTEFELRVDGRFVMREPAHEVERVAKEFPWIPHAGRSGFSFLHRPATASGALEVVGIGDGRDGGSLRTVFSVAEDPLGPMPPTSLRVRVAGDEDADFFRADGQRTYADFAAAVERHGGFEGVRRMLDWGCGCARVTAHFLADGRAGEVHGVDIDGEAAAWCAGALPAGRFQQTGAYPPLPFPDGHFDLVVAYSIFTHLERGVQKLWLAEIRRVLSPGGLLLATVHGDFAAAFSFPDRIPRTLGDRLRARFGRSPIIGGDIDDSLQDHALEGLAPPGYYRGVFQSRRYTVREWSRILPVVEYREAGAGNYQDLVVLRRPGR